MEYTDEQRAILEAVPTTDCPLRIRAFAGTGKTTMLREYAKRHPGDSMVYLAYNRALREEAERTMPRNVRSRTIHSLAYRPVGLHYAQRNLLQGGSIRVRNVMALEKTIGFRIAYAVCRTVESFVASSDPEITAGHIPKAMFEFALGGGVIRGATGKGEKEMEAAITVVSESCDRVVSLARDVWDAMKSFREPGFKMTHDGYLKLYQLAGRGGRAKIVLVDEAQDMTPCMWDVIENHKGSKVVVGDKFQALYGWRGAKDFLSRVTTDPELDFALTRSFRFGNAVAEVASSLLSNATGESIVLHGNPDVETSVEVLGDGKGCPRGGVVLCRGNAEIFRGALESSKHAKIGIIGGSKGCRLQDMADVQYLMCGRRDSIQNEFIASFESLDQLQDYTEAVGDIGLAGACDMAKKHGLAIHGMIDAVRNAETDPGRAPIRFSTVHKSKGMEWPVVCVGRDLERILVQHIEDPDSESIDDDFVNILYVALTRGASRVLCPETLLEFAAGGQDYVAAEREKIPAHKLEEKKKKRRRSEKESESGYGQLLLLDIRG